MFWLCYVVMSDHHVAQQHIVARNKAQRHRRTITLRRYYQEEGLRTIRREP